MTIEEARLLLNDEDNRLTSDEIDLLSDFFMNDANEETLYIPEFMQFSFIAASSTKVRAIDVLHHCTQQYIANVSTKPELKKKHLPFLYLREVEYYSVMNSYSECIRCINKILELDYVPDFAMGAALSQAVDIFISCGLKNEASKYVESMRVFANLCDLPPRNVLMLDCNLMQAYAFMGMRKEYEFHRNNAAKAISKGKEQNDVTEIAKLYILGAEAVIDRMGKPSREYIREFRLLVSSGLTSTQLTANLSEAVVPIVKWVRDSIPIDELVKATLSMIRASESMTDKIDMYAVLTEELQVDRVVYSFVYDDYKKLLRAYYVNAKEAHRHEVVGEMMAYELERKYKERAMTDELTKIGNRHAYEAAVDEIKGDCVEGRLPGDVVIFAFDLNGLKGVNDKYGHQAGDNYIKGAAVCLSKALKMYGKVYRVGGDEFTGIVRADSFDVEKVTSAIAEACDAWTDDYGNHLSIATGFSKSEDNQALNLDELIHVADEMMYSEKSKYYIQTGKDRRTR